MTSTGKYITCIEMTQNMFGYLKPHMKSALYEYIEFPNQYNWNQIYNMMIGKGKFITVWQAILELDPTFPNRISKEAYSEDGDNVWERIPKPELLLKALNLMFANNIELQNKRLN